MGEDSHKLRVRRAFVLDVVDACADLRGADLRGAVLSSAVLSSAVLRGAVLSSAVYNQLTLWPEGFDPFKAGAHNIT